MPLGGTQKGGEPARPLPSLRRQAGRDQSQNGGGGQRTARGPEPSGRGDPIARVGGDYSFARGGERDASVEGDVLTSPSRASNPCKLSPPVVPPHDPPAAAAARAQKHVQGEHPAQ